ncbi:MAG: NAD-dependent epimerase/dehydratase family protein [Flavobacteriales bacterium]
MKKIGIIGASGLTGGYLLETLTESNETIEIISLTRKKMSINLSKTIEILTNFSEKEIENMTLEFDVLFCCIGTTIKKAGSKKEFKRVDFGIPLSIAKRAKMFNTKKFILISSTRANSSSSNFYLKTKGEIEDEILKLNFPYTHFIRPSPLLGKRAEKRAGEKMGQMISRLLSFLFVGPLKKYKAIEAKRVAKAMFIIAKKDSAKIIYENDELFDITNRITL